MAQKKKTADALVEDMKQEMLDMIDEKIEALEAKLKPYEKLIELRNNLRAQRRALLGGNKLTGGSGARVRQEDMVEFLGQHPEGVSVADITKHFDSTQSTISSHLYRGKHDRYIKRDNRWFLRDPKTGMDNEEGDE